MADQWSVNVRQQTPSATFEVCRCVFPTPNEVVLCEESPTLSLLLTDRNRPKSGRFQDLPSSEFIAMGSMIFHPSRTTLCTRGEGGEQQFLRVAFHDSASEEDPHLFPDYSNPAVQRRLMQINGPLLEQTMRRIAQELAAPGLASNLLLEGLGLQLSAELIRYMGQSEPPNRGGLAPWQLRRIRERIFDEALTPPSCAELAELVRLSPRHLARAYRISTQTTLSEAVADARHERAEQLVSAGRLSLGEIARTLGFANLSSFSTAFSRRAGCSPSDFARRLV
jgi:AraC family transcriptional regulator